MAEPLSPLGLSQYRLAREIRACLRRISEIGLRKRGIGALTALRLSGYFARSERFWLNLQVRFDVEAERDRVGERSHHEVAVFARVG